MVPEYIADQKAKIEHYRQNIVPLNASVTNNWERYLLAKIAMNQCKLSRRPFNYKDKEFFLRKN